MQILILAVEVVVLFSGLLIGALIGILIARAMRSLDSKSRDRATSVHTRAVNLKKRADNLRDPFLSGMNVSERHRKGKNDVT
jgi:predicted lipid-binding transport protein (Tim44 family)